jgi:hypothetical protein
MPEVKGTALLPRGEANGLTAIADELHKQPRKLRAALVVLDCKRGTTDFDLDDDVLTVRIRRVELLLPQDLNAAETMIRRALEFRSGQTTLDLDLEEEIKRAFDEMREPDSPVDPDEPDKGAAGGTS